MLKYCISFINSCFLILSRICAKLVSYQKQSVTSQVLALVPINFARFVCVIYSSTENPVEYHHSNNETFAQILDCAVVTGSAASKQITTFFSGRVASVSQIPKVRRLGSTQSVSWLFLKSSQCQLVCGGCPLIPVLHRTGPLMAQL